MRWPAANTCLTILFLPVAVYQVRHRESAWPHESFASLCQEPQRSQCQSLCHGSPGSPAPTRPRPYHGCGPGGGAGGGYPSDDPCSCRGPTVWAPATPANGAVIRAAAAVAANRRQNILRFIVAPPVGTAAIRIDRRGMALPGEHRVVADPGGADSQVLQQSTVRIERRSPSSANYRRIHPQPAGRALATTFTVPCTASAMSTPYPQCPTSQRVFGPTTQEFRQFARICTPPVSYSE
jgi:hypothetical protein